MEDRKRTALAAVIILVVLAAVLYSFSMNLFGPTPELVLPDPDATASTGPSAEPSGGQGGVLVEVSPQTVQSLIASLSRYESYSRTAAVAGGIYFCPMFWNRNAPQVASRDR